MKDDQPANSQPEKPMKFRSTLPTFPEGRPVTGAEYEAFIKERIEASGNVLESKRWSNRHQSF